MPKVTLLNQQGEDVGTLELMDRVFGIEPNQQVLHDVVKAQRAAARQGTHKTKTRGEVRGGGRKPWRQKGTGRARQGSIRAPHWKGGGTVFGPTPRNYRLKMNRKVRNLALRSALSDKLQDQALYVLDELTFDAPKTKAMVEMLEQLSLEKRVLIVIAEDDYAIERSATNLSKARVVTVDELTVYDIVGSDALLTTQSAVKALEEVLG